jgi:hypothetical protein
MENTGVSVRVSIYHAFEHLFLSNSEAQTDPSGLHGDGLPHDAGGSGMNNTLISLVSHFPESFARRYTVITI